MVEAGESAPLATGFRNTIPPTGFFRAVVSFCVGQVGIGVYGFLVPSKIVWASEQCFAFGIHATVRFRFA